MNTLILIDLIKLDQTPSNDSEAFVFQPVDGVIDFLNNRSYTIFIAIREKPNNISDLTKSNATLKMSQ